MKTPDRAVNDKIRTLEEISALSDKHKAAGQKVVHCHGVFDLLHIGHIRHLQEAKRHGDILVITITPDRFVNKGPGRPAFTERLRAEALAALGFVDYVAVNSWPNAVETIGLVKPDYYVKGPDYKTQSSDVTGGIAKEEAAIHAVGGQLVITEDITFSSSKLINQYFSPFPVETAAYIASFAQRYTTRDLTKWLDQARDLKVLVIGDAIIDEYQFCEAIGKSSKEPMLALKHLWTERYAGGILAVGNHVAAFSDRVGMVTQLGAQNTHEAFVRENLNDKISSRFAVRADAPTIVKRRFVEQYFFTKLLEVYEFNDARMSAQDNDRLCDELRSTIEDYDLVVVVDFGHGMLSKEAIEIICSKAKALCVNAQANAGNLGYHAISKYRRADFLCVAEKEIRLEARDREGDLRSITLEVAKRVGARRVIVTRGKTGCLVWDANEGFFDVPSLTTTVVDRMGAGDALLSVASICAVQGAPMEVVGFIGNAAGAHAVATVGHRNSIDKASFYKTLDTFLK